MSKIFIQTVPGSAARVDVHTDDANGSKDHRQGNLDTTIGSEVVWETTPGHVRVKGFSVKFVDLGSGARIWPFEGSGGGIDGMSLELPATGSKPLKTNVGGETLVKYEVSATPIDGGAAIDNCDPMIIIRPTRLNRLVFGVICAAAGAIVGALLALALSA